MNPRIKMIPVCSLLGCSIAPFAGADDSSTTSEGQGGYYAPGGVMPTRVLQGGRILRRKPLTPKAESGMETQKDTIPGFASGELEQLAQSLRFNT